MSFLRNYSISRRLLVVAMLTLLVVGSLVSLFAYNYHASLLEARSTKTQHLVESGLGVMAYFHTQEATGVMSKAEAQNAAIAAIGDMRYGNNDYYWIQNRDLVMVHHPFSQKLNGTDISTIADPNGKRLFSEMERKIAAHGKGYVAYAWPKPGFEQPVDKISYVESFAPWGWVLGSGIYLDDVSDDFWATMAPQLILAGAGLTLLIGLSLLIARSILSPLQRTVMAMTDIASGEGDLTRRLDTNGNDELMSLAKGFNQFCDKLSAVINELRALVNHNRQISSQVDRAMADAKTSYNQQKQELDTVASAVEQMSVTSQDVAQRITESAEAAQSAGEHSESGQRNAQTTRDAMERLATDIAATSDAIAELDQQSNNISGVLDVIHSVAEQTNLLALNAAIEAARAGEQGRGFAVVADEVRTLASRTQASTDEIREMINGLLTNTARAVKAMKTSHDQSETMRGQVEEVKTILSTINGSVSTITDMTHHIASAAEQQSQTSHTIAASLNQLTRLSDDVLNDLNDTAANTANLNETSANLERLIDQFKT